VIVVSEQVLEGPGQGRAWPMRRVVGALLLFGLFGLSIRWEYPGLRLLARDVIKATPSAAPYYAAAILGGFLGGAYMLVSEHGSTPAFRRKAWVLIEVCTGLSALGLIAQASHQQAPWYGAMLAAAPVAVSVAVLYLVVLLLTDGRPAELDTSIRGELAAARSELEEARRAAFVAEQASRQAAETFEAGRADQERRHAAELERVRTELETRQEDRRVGGAQKAHELAAAELRRRREADPEHRLLTPTELHRLWGKSSGLSLRSCERGLKIVRDEDQADEGRVLPFTGGSHG
jgi:hypothetical protein